MYEKDKARYEKEMKQYTKEKLPKEPTKLLKTKKQKSKKTSKLPELAKCYPDETSLTQTTDNNAETLINDSSSSQFDILNNMSFTNNLPSPMLDIGVDNDEESFNTFDYDTV